jgi:hypothetical protein
MTPPQQIDENFFEVDLKLRPNPVTGRPIEGRLTPPESLRARAQQTDSQLFFSSLTTRTVLRNKIRKRRVVKATCLEKLEATRVFACSRCGKKAASRR